MKRLSLYPYAVLLVLVALFTSCSAPEETSGPPSTGATQQSNSNSVPQSQIAQSNAPGESPVPPPPAVNPTPPKPAPSEKSAEAKTSTTAKAPDAPTADNTRAPKLVIPEEKFEFGKQPQGKTLVRAIVVKNGGRADLKIESVVPS